MRSSKRHHYVPVFYLNRWRGDDGRVHVLRNRGGKILRDDHAPKHVGFEFDLYSYDEAYKAEDPAEMETKFFKPLDNAGALIVTKFLSDVQLLKEDLILWSQFLASMRVRNPENVAKIRTGFRQALLREIEGAQTRYSSVKQQDDPSSVTEWIEARHPGLVDSIGVGRLPKVASDPRVMKSILEMSWHAVNFSRSSVPLLTSDTPCIYTEGLDNPNCVIALPLSPEVAFFAFRKSSHAEKALKSTPISRLARALNESVVSQAKARAYCRRPSDVMDSFVARRLSPS